MNEFNVWVYEALDAVYGFVARAGMPLAILAWITVFFAALAMVFVLRRHNLKGRLGGPLLVGGLSLFAHLLDYQVTLEVSPDLAMEANPLWNVIVDRLGLPLARAYGFSGKVLLSVLSFEFYAFYVAQREFLFPEKHCGFWGFQRAFGDPNGSGLHIRINRLVNLFAFLFAWVGPFMFYIALLNSVTDQVWISWLPAMPMALAGWMFAEIFAYMLFSYRAYRRWWIKYNSGSSLSNPP